MAVVYNWHTGKYTDNGVEVDIDYVKGYLTHHGGFENSNSDDEVLRITTENSVHLFYGTGSSGNWGNWQGIAEASQNTRIINTPPMAGQAQGGGNNALQAADKHINGGVGTVGVAVQGYNKIPNTVKRTYAYKLSKATGVKSGRIFQGAKGFANGAGKFSKALGPAGTVLAVVVVGYEIGSDTWDAHTIVNGGLIVGAGVAAVFAAPAVLTGIAIYGVADYFFDIGGAIDNNVGRDSGVW